MNGLREVHYEITDKCNSGCPQCVRTDPSTCKPWPWITKQECDLESFKLYSPPYFLKQLSFIYFCGNFGDPALARDLLPILEYCYQSNPRLSIKVHSNCGVRPESWWADLAKAVKNYKFMLVASIDGASAETLADYRVGVQFEKVMQNTAAFIQNGGRAEWRFIAFKHNEHETLKAETMASEAGFVAFKSYASSRFFGASSFAYAVDNVAKQLQPAESALPKFKQQKQLAPSELLSDTDVPIQIHCHARASSSIYIDSEGFIYPCCHIGIRAYTFRRSVRDVNGDSSIYEIFEKYDLDQLNINRVGFDLALTHCKQFMTLLEPYWQSKQPFVCKMICGKK